MNTVELEEELREIPSVSLTSVEVEEQEVILVRADELPAGIKTFIGKGLLLHYMKIGQINDSTKAVVVQGSGNTVRAVKAAVDELGLDINVVAVIYSDTSDYVIDNLTADGIEVVPEVERKDGRLGRQALVEDLCRRDGYFYLEQHEQPKIVEIQLETFGRAILGQLKTPPTEFTAGVGTGGTLFGIGSAFQEVNPTVNITAVEGVGSTLTLWYAYLQAKGKGFEAEKTAIEQALQAYEEAGMIVSLVCHPEKEPDEWFEISIDFPETGERVLGIEGLGVGEPTGLIVNNLPQISGTRIITNDQARAGVDALESYGIPGVESAGANFASASQIAAEIREQRQDTIAQIVTVITAEKPASQ